VPPPLAYNDGAVNNTQDLHVVYSTFVSTPPPALSIYDEVCGITLSQNLEPWLDMYELGLWLVAPVRNSSL
jgi:hypothetical protein